MEEIVKFLKEAETYYLATVEYSGWGLYNKNGSLTTEAIENFMLFVPFSIFLLWAFHKELLGTADILKAKNKIRNRGQLSEH